MRASCLATRALCIFVAPPSHAELERRLRGRGTETEEKVLKRLANAASEIEKSEVGRRPMLRDLAGGPALRSGRKGTLLAVSNEESIGMAGRFV